jgi:hypothetical protein
VARNEYHFVITVQGVNVDGNLVHHSVQGLRVRRGGRQRTHYPELVAEAAEMLDAIVNEGGGASDG